MTHGISFLPAVDNILVIKDGRLSESGSFQHLLDRKGDFAEFLRIYFIEEKGHLEEAGEKCDELSVFSTIHVTMS